MQTLGEDSEEGRRKQLAAVIALLSPQQAEQALEFCFQG